jgi:hypothetical protein
MRKIIAFSNGIIAEQTQPVLVYNSMVKVMEVVDAEGKTEEEVDQIKQDLTEKYKTIP